MVLLLCNEYSIRHSRQDQYLQPIKTELALQQRYETIRLFDE